MASSFEQYVAAQQGAAANDDSVGDKMLREAQLITGGIVFGAGEAARDAIDHPWATAGKFTAGALAGYTIGLLTRRGSFLAPVIGTAFTAGFIKDIVPRTGHIAQAMSNTWQSADSFEQDKAVTKQALGQFVFDSALMTAGGLAGGAFSRMPTRAERFEQKLLKQLHQHDEEMGFHSERVGKLSGLIAKEMGLSRADISRAEHAGLGHDFGKLKVPQEILRGRNHDLTPDQRAIINTHPVHTKALLEPAPYGRQLADVPLIASQHHEHLNGTGYPFKMTGDQIGTPARVVAVADKFDAMLGPRTYQAGHSPTEIIQILQREVTANHVDANVVKALLRLPAKDVYGIAQIGHQPIPKQYMLSMEGLTLGDLARNAGHTVPQLVPAWSH